MKKEIIIKIFNSDIYDDIIKRWNEPHRHYHNINHLNYIINKICDLSDKLSILEFETMVIAAYFHDVIYDTTKNNNEIESIDYFTCVCEDLGMIMTDDNLKMFNDVTQIIDDTKLNTQPTTKLSKIFWEIDNSIYKNGFSVLLEWENNIFKEFQFVSYEKYKKGRIKFLNTCFCEDEKINHNIRSLIDYINNRVIRVGVYAGSFNPFHIGHYDILKKSEKIFDKVIIAFGENPDKEIHTISQYNALKYNEVIKYNGLITDLLYNIQGDNVKPTLIRGIRNGNDLSYESNQIAYINDIRPNTDTVMILSDKKYEHVSSSSIRNLLKYNSNVNKYLIK